MGGITLLVPGFPILKEWAYAGFTFAWIAATVAHYLAGDGAAALVPPFLLVVLAVSYVTRPDNRRLRTRATSGVTERLDTSFDRFSGVEVETAEE